LEKQSLYSIFEQTCKRKLQWAEEPIGAVIAGEEESSSSRNTSSFALALVATNLVSFH
jgi:hypothetical protein